MVWFSITDEVEYGSYILNDQVVFKNRTGQIQTIIDCKNIKLMGRHNLENVIAAVTVALEAGASVEHIQNVLRSFGGVKHRLQFVRELQGIKYYNDSKATNSLATSKAIQAFADPIILIAGGLDRGETFTNLEPLFSAHLKGIVVYGEIKEKIAQVAKNAGVNHIIHVDNVKEAVEASAKLAQSGDVVLLSPAAASWDQFKSFEERGDMFTDSVHKLR